MSALGFYLYVNSCGFIVILCTDLLWYLEKLSLVPVSSNRTIILMLCCLFRYTNPYCQNFVSIISSISWTSHGHVTLHNNLQISPLIIYFLLLIFSSSLLYHLYMIVTWEYLLNVLSLDYITKFIGFFKITIICLHM